MSRTEVSGIERSPIYVVSTEAEVWSVSQEDYLAGVGLRDLLAELGEGQHVYLVHLGEGKLTQLV